MKQNKPYVDWTVQRTNAFPSFHLELAELKIKCHPGDPAVY